MPPFWTAFKCNQIQKAMPGTESCDLDVHEFKNLSGD